VERSITDEIMYALMELSGQEYVDVYAAKVKEEMTVRTGRPRSAAPQQDGTAAAARLPHSRAG
jgi:1-acyl-sn-glycerol-3-phosphate acyltransferase